MYERFKQCFCKQIVQWKLNGSKENAIGQLDYIAKNSNGTP